MTHTIKEPRMVLQSFRSSYSSKNRLDPNGSIPYVIAIYISFLLEYEELANHIIRNNDHNLCNQLHQKAAPVQTVDEHKQHQFFHTKGQQASAEETGQLCPEALGRIRCSIEDPGLNWNNTQITQSTTLAKSAPQPKRFVKRTNSAKFRKTARPPKKRYRSTSLCLLYQGFKIRSPGKPIMRSKMSSRVFSIIISQIQYQTAKPQVISLCRARDRQCESKLCFPVHIKSCQRRKYGTAQRTRFLRSGIFCNIFVVNKLQRKSVYNCCGQRFL